MLLLLLSVMDDDDDPWTFELVNMDFPQEVVGLDNESLLWNSCIINHPKMGMFPLRAEYK